METSGCLRYSLLATILLAVTSARAATLIVNSAADDGTGTCTVNKCTLRDAILSAHSGDRITFSLAANSTIVLTNGSLSIDKSLVIIGPGPKSLTVQRSAAAGTADFRVIDIPSSSPSVNISGLTIANGIDHSADGGGAIHNVGFLTLVNCTISGSVGTQIAGGISNAGTLLIDSSTIAGNSAPAAGGIYNFGVGTVDLSNSTVSGNSNDRGSGGGILNYRGGALSIGNRYHFR